MRSPLKPAPAAADATSVDGVGGSTGAAAVFARMSQIEARISALATAGTRTAASVGRAAAGTSGAAFADVLAQQVASASPSRARLTADGVPAELAQYGNGRVPAAALEGIGRGSHRLWSPAAGAFRDMAAAAARDGVDIGVTDSYRSYEAQVDVARRKGLYSQGGLAAEPGTSDHGWGRALDLDLDREALSWMRANASRFGFVEDTPREPWHWAYEPPS